MNENKEQLEAIEKALKLWKENKSNPNYVRVSAPLGSGFTQQIGSFFQSNYASLQQVFCGALTSASDVPLRASVLLDDFEKSPKYIQQELANLIKENTDVFFVIREIIYLPQKQTA